MSSPAPAADVVLHTKAAKADMVECLKTHVAIALYLESIESIDVCDSPPPDDESAIAWLDGVDRKLASLRIRDKKLGQLPRAKYFAEPPAREGRPGRNEFIIRKEADLQPFLKAAGALR